MSTRAPVDVRPRAQEHRQALARLVPADEDDVAVAPVRIEPLGQGNAVRNHLDGRADVRLGAAPRRLGDGDAVVDSSRENAPEPPSQRVPAEPLAGRVAGGDDRARCRGERERRENRRQRLMDVDDVEALALPDPAHPHHGLRAEDDVRKRGVGRDDDRSPDGDDVVGRPRVPPLLRMEQPRQPPGRVVAHDDPDVVAEPLQRARLMIRVLLDSAPERPGVGDDDPDLHASTLPARQDQTPRRQGRCLGRQPGCWLWRSGV